MKIPTPRKLPSGSWNIHLRLGGESISITEVSRAECVRIAQKTKADYLADKKTRPTCQADPTLREVCERYIQQKEKLRRSPETVRGYDIIMRNRFQSAMDLKLREIRNWQELYNAEAAKYGPKTMANTWAFIRAACASTGVTLPQIETVAPRRTEHAFLEPDEIRAFIRASEGDPYRIALLLALQSCRVSEILAIDWTDVDLEKERVEIRGALVRDRLNKKVEKTENKTKDSTRTLPIFIPELLAELRAVPQKSGKVVVANENTLLKHANRVCDAASVHRVGVHGLRHSFASLCYALTPQVPERIVMQLGGWNNPRTVNEIYTHLSKKEVGKHIDSLREFFKNANGNGNDNNKP